jgi:flagellar protein FliS
VPPIPVRSIVGPKFASTPMYDARQQYQQQSVQTAPPEKLVEKLYDEGISACHQGDREHLRNVLVELRSSLDLQNGGEVAERLQAIYDFCLRESASGDLDVVHELLDELRDGWREGVLEQQPA